MSKVKTDSRLAAKLKLSPKLAEKLGLRKLTNDEARKELGIVNTNKKDYSGTAFEGYDLDGEYRGVYQLRRDNPEIDDKGREDGKYVCRPRSAGYPYLNTTPGGLKDGEHVIVVESVKSAWAIAASAEREGRRNIRVVDIHGIPGWRVCNEKEDESHPNRDLLKLAGHKVTLAFDTNFLRDDLIPQVEKFENFLHEIGCDVDAMQIKPEEDVNGPDDLIAKKNGDKLFWEAFERRKRLVFYQCPPISDFEGQETNVQLLIRHLFADRTLTMFASPSENYKTMMAMCSCSALLSKVGSVAFECQEFEVLKSVPGVLYMVPDMSFELAVTYARKFGLDKDGSDFIS